PARGPGADRTVAGLGLEGGGRQRRAGPVPAPAAEHPGRDLPEGRGAPVMPIFDQGYQHWSGELTGHGRRWLAITRHGVRIGMKNRLLRIALLVAWLPAVVLASFLCVWGLLEQKSDLVQPLVPFL